jgi:hypothetical protein
VLGEEDKLKTLIYEAGRAALKAGVVTFLTFASGLLAATNLKEFSALAVAALVASGVAALKAVQVFIPKLSFAGLLPTQPVVASYLDAFTIAFLSAAVVLLQGVSDAPNYETAKGLVVAAIIGALQAAFRALEGLATRGEFPVRQFGTEV